MPTWVEDETIWDKAKKAVDRKKYPNDDSYWAVVVTVYKKMGGKVKEKKKEKYYNFPTKEPKPRVKVCGNCKHFKDNWCTLNSIEVEPKDGCNRFEYSEEYLKNKLERLHESICLQEQIKQGDYVRITHIGDYMDYDTGKYADWNKINGQIGQVFLKGTRGLVAIKFPGDVRVWVPEKYLRIA